MGPHRSDSTRACRAVVVALGLALAPGGCTGVKDPSSPNHFGEGGEAGEGDDDTGDDGSTTDLLDDDGGPTTTPTTADDDDGAGTTGPSTDTGSSTASEDTLGLDDTSTAGGETTLATGDSGTDTFSDGTVQVEVVISEMWESGECDDITVTNISDEDVTWEIELELPGTIYNLWNANVVESDGVGTFTGVDFNATIAPGASAMFGFCVNY